VRNHVANPYKTNGRITAAYISIFKFLERRWEDDSELKGLLYLQQNKVRL
jgi:hypothetical protein